jgi:hypothetical protein
VNAREPAVMYLAAIAAFSAAIGLAIQEAYPQAAILAAGAAFLVYWGRRTDERRGEK